MKIFYSLEILYKQYILMVLKVQKGSSGVLSPFAQFIEAQISTQLKII